MKNFFIKQVDCTNSDFLNYYLENENITLHPELFPQNGFPAGFLVIDSNTNKIIGASMIIDEIMHNQFTTYYQNNNDGNPWMVAVGIVKNERNQGIGKLLVDAMLQYCYDLNFTHLNANTETAINFYKKHWQITPVSSYYSTHNGESKVN